MIGWETGRFGSPGRRAEAEAPRPPTATSGEERRAPPRGYSSSISGGVRLERDPSRGGEVCHCGRRLFVGQGGYRIVDFPLQVEPLLGERSFCSGDCVRVFLRESLLEIERLRSLDRERMVLDLRETYRDLSLVFEDLRSVIPRSRL
jgi:hypothetical protein